MKVLIIDDQASLSLAVAEAIVEGSRGVKWLKVNDVIDDKNPIMFTCTECLKTTRGSELPAHEPKCINELKSKLGL
jgi:hypothetical protein